MLKKMTVFMSSPCTRPIVLFTQDTVSHRPHSALYQSMVYFWHIIMARFHDGQMNCCCVLPECHIFIFSCCLLNVILPCLQNIPFHHFNIFVNRSIITFMYPFFCFYCCPSAPLPDLHTLAHKCI